MLYMCLLSLEMLLWTVVTSDNKHWHAHVRIPRSMNRNLTDKINIQLTRLWLSQVLVTTMSDLYSSVGCQTCWRRNDWSGWRSQGNGIPTEETRRGTGTRITSSRSHYRLPQWSVLSMCAAESGLESAVASWGHSTRWRLKEREGVDRWYDKQSEQTTQHSQCQLCYKD